MTQGLPIRNQRRSFSTTPEMEDATQSKKGRETTHSQNNTQCSDPGFHSTPVFQPRASSPIVLPRNNGSTFEQPKIDNVPASNLLVKTTPVDYVPRSTFSRVTPTIGNMDFNGHNCDNLDLNGDNSGSL